MNRTKKKILIMPEDERGTSSVTLEGKLIDGVSHYVYLGQKMSSRKKEVMDEVKKRVQLGCYAFGKIKRYLAFDEKIGLNCSISALHQC
jgi:hypothetical protein